MVGGEAEMIRKKYLLGREWRSDGLGSKVGWHIKKAKNDLSPPTRKPPGLRLIKHLH
jgi:hypothetical protein